MSFRPIILLTVALAALGTAIAGCAAAKPAPHSESAAARISPDREPIVLVCPIDRISDDEKISSLAYALAPLVRRDLFCAQKISVIPTEDTNIQTKPFILKENGLEDLGRMHGADIVTIGFLSAKPEKVAIDFKAYDCSNHYYILKTRVEGKPTEIFQLERKLVYQLIDALGITLSKEERERLTSSSPKKSEAAVEFGRGLKMERKENYTEALMAYSNALSAEDHMSAPYAAEARIYRAYNAPLKAMSSYERAVAMDPFFAEGWYQLNLYAEQYGNDEKTAIEYCRKALAVAPRFGKARLSLGARLYALGDLNGAIEETRKAIPLLSMDPLPYYNLGIYYKDAGQPEESRKWIEKALAINPGFSPARAELERFSPARN